MVIGHQKAIRDTLYCFFIIYNRKPIFYNYKYNYLSLKSKLTMICLFIVIANNTMKYITNIGQNTGMLNTEKKVHVNAINIALVIECLKNNKG